MLTAHNISKAYGLNVVLKNISFSINSGDRVGLIGPNGCGKSTLLRILAGEETTYPLEGVRAYPLEGVKAVSGAQRKAVGHVTLTPTHLQIGYLSQGFDPDPALTFAQLLHEAVGDPATLEVELTNLAIQLATSPNDDTLQQAYDHTLHQLSHSDMGKAQSLLAIFGLQNIDPTQLIGTFSGGQKTRLSLLLLMISQPHLLLLDEPTNHLDIEMLEWLEDWLAKFSGGVLLVSHDRTFLDRIVTRILDLNPKTSTVREYAGNYTDYLAQYVQERETQFAEWKDQQDDIQRMKQDIARAKAQAADTERRVKSVRIGGIKEGKDHYLRLAKKVAKKGKSREKKLDRYLDSDEIVEKPSQSWQMRFDLNNAPHLGRDVLTLENLSIGYDMPLLSNLNQHLQSGQRVIITGPNGAGKTTLLRTIAGQLEPLAGRARLGGSVRLGYMSQEQELLDLAQTPLQSIQEAAPLNQTEARSFLHYFLFSGNDPLRPIGSLSYGERSRLSLALLVASGYNFLLLDEPINHLDIPSRTMFEQALSQFNGAILAVVHDRYFIERYASELWVVADGRLETQLQ